MLPSLQESKKKSLDRKVNTYTARPHVSSVESVTWWLGVRTTMRATMQQTISRKPAARGVEWRLDEKLKDISIQLFGGWQLADVEKVALWDELDQDPALV